MMPADTFLVPAGHSPWTAVLLILSLSVVLWAPHLLRVLPSAVPVQAATGTADPGGARGPGPGALCRRCSEAR